MALPAIKRNAKDRRYTAELKKRQNNTCQRCHKVYPPLHRGLHCSHFFSRRRPQTRYFLENTDLLCYGCHMVWQKEERAEYIKFKKKQLGEKRYNYLRQQALSKGKEKPAAVKYVFM